MRKAFFLLCLAAGLLSCAKDALNSGEGDTQNEGAPMTFNVTVAETKAVKANWANGDKIYVFFNGLATKYLVLTYDGTEWTNTSGGGTLLDSDFSDLGTKTLTAVHFPVAVDVSYDEDMDSNGWFSFTSGGEPVYTYYLFERDTDYTVSGTTVTASLSMGKPDNMALFHVAGIQGNISDYTFGSSMIVPVACASVGTNGLIFKSELATGERVGGIADNDGGVFAGRLVRPGTAQNYNFYLADKNKIYALTRTEKTLTAGKMYNFPAPSVTGGANWDIAAVNLGLKSGSKPLYWATRNIGATTETDYGYYFAWGETRFKDKYTTSTYLYYGCGHNSVIVCFTVTLNSLGFCFTLCLGNSNLGFRFSFLYLVLCLEGILDGLVLGIDSGGEGSRRINLGCEFPYYESLTVHGLVKAGTDLVLKLGTVGHELVGGVVVGACAICLEDTGVYVTHLQLAYRFAVFDKDVHGLVFINLICQGGGHGEDGGVLGIHREWLIGYTLNIGGILENPFGDRIEPNPTAAGSFHSALEFSVGRPLLELDANRCGVNGCATGCHGEDYKDSYGKCSPCCFCKYF